METATETELQRRSEVYDALMGDPGYVDLETLREWRRLVKGIQVVVGPLTERLNRIAAHIANLEGAVIVADQERRMSAS